MTTVTDLIEYLQKLPGKTVVMLFNNDYVPLDISSIKYHKDALFSNESHLFAYDIEDWSKTRQDLINELAEMTVEERLRDHNKVESLVKAIDDCKNYDPRPVVTLN